MSRECFRRPAPVRDPPVLPGLRLEKHGRIVEPTLGRVALVTGLVALSPLPARSQAVESVVGVTHLDCCLPVNGRGVIDRCLQTAIDPVEFASARFLDVTGRGLLTATDRVHDPLFAREVAVTGRGHAIPLAALVTVCDQGCSRFSPLTARGQGIEAGAPGVSCGRVWRLWLSPRLPLFQEASAAVAPPVVGGTVAAFLPAVQDLTGFFLSLAGSSSQGAVVGAVGTTVPASVVRVQLYPSAPGGGAAASCAMTLAPSLAARPSSASASVPGSSS